MMNDETLTPEKERYWGSVRFFKHLILTCVALAVIIPTFLAVFFGFRVHSLSVSNNYLFQENQSLNNSLSDASALLNDLQTAQAEKKAAQTTYLSSQENNQWQLLLVNDWHPLPEDYTVTLASVANDQKVDERIAEPLTDMLTAMQKEKLRPVICSSYRSVERQTELFQEYITEKLDEGWSYENAFYNAKTRIAAPGTSEHQTGLSVDIVGKSHQSLDAEQADTKEAQWLKEHCAEYGFILRFPADKEDVTGVDYESWHFRYVGTDAASYIMEHEITLEEYLDLMEHNS